MTDTVTLRKIDDVYVKVICDPGIAYELKDHFSFQVPGYKFMPAYRNKYWDGKIYLFNPLSCTIYAGLVSRIEEFCKKNSYDLEMEYDGADAEFSVIEAEKFISTLDIPSKFSIRDYQLDTFVRAVRKRRELYVSPTASGKSLMIYLLTRHYLEAQESKVLVIVPTIQLVKQMYSDFAEYGFDSEELVHQIMGGYDKNTNKRVIVTTWQSIFKLDQSWFDQFGVVIGDEAHLYKAKSLTTIMSSLRDCQYRFGFTGTLDGTQTNEMVLNGLFGPTRQVTTTSKLMEEGTVAELLIKILVLTYEDDVKKLGAKLDYQSELDWLVTLPERNKFIKNLALSLKGNTLVLFQFVEKHGKPLHELIASEAGDGRNVYYISGEVDGDSREDIRKIIETEEDAIIVASSGTFSTGTNMKKLHNLIFASPSKGKIKNLQSIGRALRTHESKTIARLFDVADDLSWKTSKNHTLRHLIERIKIYISEGFRYKIYNVSTKISSPSLATLASLRHD